MYLDPLAPKKILATYLGTAEKKGYETFNLYTRVADIRLVGTVIYFELNNGKVERVENTMEYLSIELRLLFTRRNLFTLHI